MGHGNDNVHLRQGPVEKFAFDLMQSMVQGNDLPDAIATFLLLTEDLQLCLFALSPEFNIRNLPYVLLYILDPSMVFTNFDPHLPDGNVPPLATTIPNLLLIQWILWGISVFLIFLALATAIHVGIAFRRGKFHGLSLLSLKILRVLTMLFGSILFIPMLQLLMMNLNCNYNANRLTDHPTVQCLSGTNFPLYIVSVISILIFIPYAISTASIYFSFDPAAKSHHARNPISYFDTLYMTARVSIVVLFSLVHQPGFLAVWLILSTGYVLYVHGVSQPFYRETFNRLRFGSLLSAFLSAIVAGISLLVETPKDDTKFVTAWGVVLVVGNVGGYFAGILVKRLICKRVYRQMKRLAEQHEQGFPIAKNPEVKEDPRPLGKNNNTTAGTILNSTPAHHRRSPGAFVVHMAEAIVSTRTEPRPIRAFHNPSDVELSCRFINFNRSPEAQKLVQEIFEQGLREFPENSILRLIYSRYIAAFFTCPLEFVNESQDIGAAEFREHHHVDDSIQQSKFNAYGEKMEPKKGGKRNM
ncbi:hypothetical protein HK102_010075 [Quaeritorhiza haematococci]|nr:hypothetical protein HK102_010075 [Quaeritorhiza haematococci]